MTTIPDDKTELYGLNKERVQFSKPNVKHIVSPHSASILAEAEPKPPLDADIAECAGKIFASCSINGEVSAKKIPELLVKCGFEHDLALLTKVVLEFYSGPDTLDANAFMAFAERFHAPAYNIWAATETKCRQRSQRRSNEVVGAKLRCEHFRWRRHLLFTLLLRIQPTRNHRNLS